MSGAVRSIDDAARAAIRNDLGNTLFVEAGAGTGKTAALVDRYVELVRNGVSVERIAAITFTERAAAELRERVRFGLEETDSPGDSIRAAIESLDRAQISTIHSFAQTLLRSFAPEAGVDPGFEVLSDLRTHRRVDDAWRAFLEEAGRDPAARSLVDRLLTLGLRPKDLADLGKELARRGDLVRMLESNIPVASPPPRPDLARLTAAIESTGWREVPQWDRLRPCTEETHRLVSEMRQLSDEELPGYLLARLGALPKPVNGQRENWGGAAAKEFAVATLKDVHESLRTFVAGCRSVALAELLPHLVGFARGFETGRAQQGTLTFDDLILLTRDVVCTNAGVAEAIRDRYDVLLVDEFQDTDPSQMEIARRFATDPSTGSMDPGRLFIVGDPKQSIYRFRNADMTMYTHTQELLKESGARVLSLLQNKRSRRVIVDWVNTIFPSILGSTGDSVRVRYQPITHTRDVDLKGPGVAWFGHEVEAKARESRNIEAQGVAAVCRTAIAENWEVSDRVGNITTSRNRDIAILIPRRTGLIALERALSAEGVPYRVEGGSLIYGTQEVRDLINCLTAIEDPSDQVAIVGALRSPAFACSDVDLARHKAAGGRFSYGHPDLDQWEGPVADALRVLASYNARRHDQSIAALIEEFVAERGILDAAILDRCGRNVYRRMRFVAQQARAFEAAGPESIHSFVSWLEGQANEAILDNEGAGVDDDEDAVRVLTIHGAKGLEFPIVILAGLTAAPLPSRSVTLADHGSGRVAIHAGSTSQAFDLGPLDDLLALEAAHGAAEFARLLYVGATRARDHLVVSLYRGSSAKPNCAARMLIDAGIRDTTPELTVRTAPRGAAAGHFESVAIELPDYSTADVFGERRASLIRSARRRTFTSATALGRATDRSSDEAEPWARGRGGTRLGRAVHAAVQALPLVAEDSVLDAVCRAQAVAEAIPHREGDVKRLVRWITRHSVAWQRARTATRAMREVPFALVLDDKVVEGFIDLVIETPEGLEIVDWKTDQISAQEVNNRLDDYRLQAGLYTHGLQAATGRSVTAVTYVFAQPGLEVTPGEPEDLARVAIARLRSSDGALPD